MIKRPKTKFRPSEKEKIEYKNVSYRLPKDLLEELGKYVDKQKSACSLVSEILEWALEDMKRGKK